MFTNAKILRGLYTREVKTSNHQQKGNVNNILDFIIKNK